MKRMGNGMTEPGENFIETRVEDRMRDNPKC